MHWIHGATDDPEDLCLHGFVRVIIGDEILEYEGTVSATSLYLLKTIQEDHLIGQDIQMIPCCGFSIYPKADDSGDVFIVGCNQGVDWSVIHAGGKIVLVTASGNKTEISLEEYKSAVFDFVDEVEGYYNKCSPKILPEEEVDRQGYIGFWKEWHRRRGGSADE